MMAREQKPASQSNQPDVRGGAQSDNCDFRYDSVFHWEERFTDASILLESHRVKPATSSDVLIALDTNALLLPYVLKEAGGIAEYKKVLRDLAKKKRLIVPERVLREFFKNRDKKIAELIKGLVQNKSQFVLPAALPPLLEDLESSKKASESLDEIKKVKKDYDAAFDKVIGVMKGWQGDDPVTLLYAEVFSGAVFGHEGENQQVHQEWMTRCKNEIPPGYKDQDKPDTGIGDFLIWKSLIKAAKERGKDVLFVTGETKPDWVENGGSDIQFPRPELIQEFRQETGRNFRLSSMHSLLKEMSASEGLVGDVKSAEVTQAKFINAFADIMKTQASSISKDKLNSDKKYANLFSKNPIIVRLAVIEGVIDFSNYNVSCNYSKINNGYYLYRISFMDKTIVDLAPRDGVELSSFSLSHEIDGWSGCGFECQGTGNIDFWLV